MIINPAEVISLENKSHFGVHCTERKELLYVSICALCILSLPQQFKCCGLKPLNLEHKSSSDKSCFVDNDKTKERLKV